MKNIVRVVDDLGNSFTGEKQITSGLNRITQPSLYPLVRIHTNRTCVEIDVVPKRVSGILVKPEGQSEWESPFKSFRGMNPKQIIIKGGGRLQYTPKHFASRRTVPHVVEVSFLPDIT